MLIAVPAAGVDGLRRPSAPRIPAVDAVNQDGCSGRRAGPIYLIFAISDVDSLTGMVVIRASAIFDRDMDAVHLLKEIPKDHPGAARMDGRPRPRTGLRVAPMSCSGHCGRRAASFPPGLE